MIDIVKMISCGLLGSLITIIGWEIYKHRKTMKKVKLKGVGHRDRMRQHDEHLRRLQGMQQALTRRPFSWELVPEEWCETNKLSPKKRMKVHKIDQGIRKETFVGPGIYTREVDLSYYNNFRNRENE